jgi:hypothetical protein
VSCEYEFFVCRHANLLDSLVFTRSGFLALLCWVSHALSFSRTHTLSLSLGLSRAHTLARAHLLAGECLFLLAGRASASFCRARLLMPASRRVPLLACRASDCLCLRVARERICLFSWCHACVIFLFAGRRILLTVTLSLSHLSPLSVSRVLSDCVCCYSFSYMLAGWS